MIVTSPSLQPALVYERSECFDCLGETYMCPIFTSDVTFVSVKVSSIYADLWVVVFVIHVDPEMREITLYWYEQILCMQAYNVTKSVPYKLWKTLFLFFQTLQYQFIIPILLRTCMNTVKTCVRNACSFYLLHIFQENNKKVYHLVAPSTHSSYICMRQNCILRVRFLGHQQPNNRGPIDGAQSFISTQLYNHRHYRHTPIKNAIHSQTSDKFKHTTFIAICIRTWR